MAEYRIIFIGPRNGRLKHQLTLWAERACDAIDEARRLKPELAGRWVDVCRLRTQLDADDDKGRMTCRFLRSAGQRRKKRRARSLELRDVA